MFTEACPIAEEQLAGDVARSMVDGKNETNNILHHFDTKCLCGIPQRPVQRVLIKVLQEVLRQQQDSKCSLTRKELELSPKSYVLTNIF